MLTKRPAKKSALVRPARLETELLEARVFLSVSQDANGWTVVTPSSDTRTIFVSSSTGSDLNSGLSALSPVKTLTKAQSLVHTGEPDWLLLKAGDVFNGSFLNWSASGRSAQEPVLIGSYGTGARPQVNSGTASAGFNVVANAAVSVNYVDLIGVQFYEQNRDPASPTFNTSSAGGTTGFQWYAPGGNVLVENCSFRFYRNNLDIESVNGITSNFVIRRSLSADSWSTTSHSQGMYCYSLSNISVLQCVFDHNGWNTQIPGAVDAGYNHNMYFASTCSGVDVESCVIAEASYSGIMARAGGTINNNLFVNNAVAVSFGNANGADSTVGGVTGSLIGNAIVGDKSSNGTAFGEGFEIGNTKPGAGLLVANNIFTQDTQFAKAAIQLTMATATYNPQYAVGENDVTVQNNIVNGWYQGITTSGQFVGGGTGLYALNNLKVQNNDFLNSTNRLVKHDNAYLPSVENWAGNRYYDPALSQSAWFLQESNNVSVGQWLTQVDQTGKVLPSLPYADPNRSVATYDATLGGPGTWQDFLVQARSMSYTNYQPQYMAQAVIDYVNRGFTVDTTAPVATATTSNLNAGAIGSTTYTFAVRFTDDFFLNATSLGSNDLLVTGPNGFSAPATLLTAAAPTTGIGGYQTTIATYQIAAPGGEWAAGQDGTYSITLLPNQVFDKTANAAADGVVGTFAADFTPPTATAQAPDLTDTTATPGSYQFSVTYSDASGIDASSLNSNELLVTSPAGYSSYATLVGTTAGTAANGQPSLVATYTIPAPNGVWTSDANGAYTISLAAGAINDRLGNSVAYGPIATFNVNLPGGVSTSPGTASITGTVFNDANANGIFDARETPLIGVTVFLDVAGTGVFATGDPTTVTDATGAYSFTGLTPGRYTVVEQPPTGYQIAGPAVVTLTDGQALTSINFADQVGSTSTSGTGSTGGTGTGGTSTGGAGNTGTGTTGTGSTGKGTDGGRPTRTTGSGGKKAGGKLPIKFILRTIESLLRR